MKKKKSIHSKIIFTITLVLVLCFFMLTSLWTAKKNDFNSTNTKDYIKLAEPESCDYCESEGWAMSIYITRVVVADLDNTSIWDAGYGDFTPQTAHLKQGKTYSISLEKYGFYNDPIYWKIWIDFNKDCDFEDEGEEVFSVHKICGVEGCIGSITVPGDALTGDTRMRVSCGFYEPPPCGDFLWGEVEDYTVIIPDTVGNTISIGSTSISPNRRAMPFTMPEDGKIISVSMYHNGGSGSMILAVYDGEGLPDNRLGVTAATPVSGSEGWQTIEMEDCTFVSGGSTIWLAWVYENTPRIRYQTGSPGRYQSTETWSGGMPYFFGSGSQADYRYSIYANYTTPECTFGYKDVFESTSYSANRRAMPFTMPKDGTIQSITMYHNGGSGSMILAVYDGEGSPQNRLAVTPSTAVRGSTGWQTIDLISSVPVYAGSTIWLAWVYENNPGIRYQTGSPGRFQSTQTWSGGMPDPFGQGEQADYIYSIYATYTPD
jgi:hypothetical protein